MIVETVQVGQLATNCYILAGQEGGQGVVIDPGAEPDKILAAAETKKIKIVKILNTHGHWDHIGANRALAEAVGADVYIDSRDAEVLGDPQKNLSAILSDGDSQKADKLLENGETLQVDGLDILVLHTPGHTPGSSSFLAGDKLFCGDLIFLESVGRTDLPGSNGPDLFTSIREKAMSLPDAVTIFPGHGPSTTVGWEREHNPYRMYWQS